MSIKKDLFQAIFFGLVTVLCFVSGVLALASGGSGSVIIGVFSIVGAFVCGWLCWIGCGCLERDIILLIAENSVDETEEEK